MEYLRRQVDEAIPSDEFVKACGLFFFSSFLLNKNKKNSFRRSNYS
jgi:hypothetical protein